MSTPIKLLCLCAVAAAQIAVPVSMIAKHEKTLAEGAVYKFRTPPIDPVDVLRGRYVWLSLEANSAPLPENERLQDGQKVYATLDTDEDGFARFSAVSAAPPPSGDYLDAKVWWINREDRTVTLDLPIERFYMDEDLAPEAERVYQEQRGDNAREAYVVVRVRDGFPVIENLYIDDVPIADYVRGHAGE